MSYRSWVIILSGGAILALALGFRQSLGLFMSDISKDLSIGRESLSLGLGLTNLVWGLGAPFTGAIADRYGSVAILIVSGLLYAVGLAVMATSGTDYAVMSAGNQIITGGMILGFAMSGVGFSVILGVVGRAAPPNAQGLALGIASTFGSVGQFAALPYAYVLLEQFGWQQALLILAACSMIIVPLAFGMANKATGEDTITEKQSMKEAFLEASRLPGFWLLNAGFLVCGFQVVFIAVHMPAFLEDKGFDAYLGTVALSLVGIGNIIGSFACGVLGDIYSRKYLLSLLYLVRSILITTFILLPITETSVLLFSLGIGLLWLGTVPLTSGLVAQIFGTRYMSMLFGIVFLSHQVGSFFGSWWAGRYYDSVGNYDLVWWTAIALGILAALIHLPIADRPLREPVAGAAQ